MDKCRKCSSQLVNTKALCEHCRTNLSLDEKLDILSQMDRDNKEKVVTIRKSLQEIIKLAAEIDEKSILEH